MVPSVHNVFSLCVTKHTISTKILNLKLQFINGGWEPHLVIKILSAKACTITLLQNPTLCHLLFMSHWDTIVASVTADYIMSTGQCNSRYNWLWHIRKWQISSKNLKRQFSEGSAGAEAGYDMKTTYKLENGEIEDLTLGQVGSPHDLYLQPSFYFLSVPNDSIGYCGTSVGLSSLERSCSRIFPLNSLLSCS